MPKLTRVLFFSIVIGINAQLPNVTAEDQCEKTMREQDEKCDPDSWDMQRTQKCREAINNVRNACILNNPWEGQAKAAKQALKDSIDNKAAAISEPARNELAQTVSEMAILNERVKLDIASLSQVKVEIASTLADVKAKSELAVRDYEASVNRHIALVDQSSDTQYLFEQKQKIADVNFGTVDRLALEQKRLVQARVRLTGAEDRMISSLHEISQESRDEFEMPDIRNGSTVLDAALEWQIDLQNRVIDSTERVQKTVDQKITLLEVKQREQAITDETRQRLSLANELAMKTRYLSEVQGVVQQMTKARRSGYLNMPLLSETVDHARKLKGVQDFCESSTTSNWHSTGCVRANQYKTNVSRILGTSTMTTIRLSTSVFDRSTNDEAVSLNANLKQRVANGDFDGSVATYDAILNILESAQ